MTRPDRVRRAVGAALAAAALVVLPALPASAHVLIETVEPNGDGTATITFTFDHGCDGEPTDALRVAMPDGVEAVGATQPDGWTSVVQPRSVSWQGEPVPDGDRIAFELEVRVEGEVGQAFLFPAEQDCPSGASYTWTDTDATGDHPAPSFVATTAVLASSPTDPTTDPAAAPAGAAPTPLGPLVVGVVGASVLAGLAGAWAVRARRT
ncbi:DUF1775 domain-containing protein [Cellulosimicrobium terreum]|nr:DUF1775 domain-containing protein [Cellulosimicrobium terreum]